MSLSKPRQALQGGEPYLVAEVLAGEEFWIQLRAFRPEEGAGTFDRVREDLHPGGMS